MATSVKFDQQNIVICIVSIFMVDAGLVAMLLYQMVFKTKILKRRLKQSGTAVNATILSAKETSVTINNRPLIAIEVEIHDSLVGKFTAKLYKQYSFVNPVSMKPGEKLAVLYNPNNTNEVVIDD